MSAKHCNVTVITILWMITVLMMSFSCSSKEKTERIIRQMTEETIAINKNAMECWIPDNNFHITSNLKKKYSLVVYVDSTQCSPCFIKRMTEWNEILTLEQNNNYSVQFFFIIEPQKGESNLLKSKLFNSGFKHTVLIDKQYNFIKQNPHIPKDAMYHTFLLDEDNKVVLVGNPLRNNRIKEIFLRTVNKKQ